MAQMSKLSLIAAMLLVTTCAVQQARATELPSDLCLLLQAAEVSKTLGRAYDSPQKRIAPRPSPTPLRERIAIILLRGASSGSEPTLIRRRPPRRICSPN
jgi:hypothetical protein